MSSAARRSKTPRHSSRAHIVRQRLQDSGVVSARSRCHGSVARSGQNRFTRATSVAAETLQSLQRRHEQWCSTARAQRLRTPPSALESDFEQLHQLVKSISGAANSRLASRITCWVLGVPGEQDLQAALCIRLDAVWSMRAPASSPTRSTLRLHCGRNESTLLAVLVPLLAQAKCRYSAASSINPRCIPTTLAAVVRTSPHPCGAALDLPASKSDRRRRHSNHHPKLFPMRAVCQP